MGLWVLNEWLGQTVKKSEMNHLNFDLSTQRQRCPSRVCLHPPVVANADDAIFAWNDDSHVDDGTASLQLTHELRFPHPTSRPTRSYPLCLDFSSHFRLRLNSCHVTELLLTCPADGVCNRSIRYTPGARLWPLDLPILNETHVPNVRSNTHFTNLF